MTVVESIVPGGVGRSRIIEATSEVDSDSATTERIDGKKSDQGRSSAIRRLRLRRPSYRFFSGVGINFQAIASNDALISDRIMAVHEGGPSVRREWRRVGCRQAGRPGALHYPFHFQEVGFEERVMCENVVTYSGL